MANSRVILAILVCFVLVGCDAPQSGLGDARGKPTDAQNRVSVDSRLLQVKSALLNRDEKELVRMCDPNVLIEHKTIAYRQDDDVSGNAVARLDGLDMPAKTNSSDFVSRVETGNSQRVLKESVRRFFEAAYQDGSLVENAVVTYENGISNLEASVRGPRIEGRIYSNVDFIIELGTQEPWLIERILIVSH